MWEGLKLMILAVPVTIGVLILFAIPIAGLILSLSQ